MSVVQLRTRTDLTGRADQDGKVTVSAPPALASRDDLGKATRYILLGTVAVFAAWSLAAPLHRGATSSGRLETSDARALIKSFDGGVIKEISASQGQVVQKGQKLAQFDIDTALLSLQQLIATRTRLTIDKAIYQAEIDGRIEPQLPEGFVVSDPASAGYLEVQKAALRARIAARNSAKGALAQQRQARALEAQGLNQQLASQARQMASIASEEADMRTLYNKGYAPKQRVVALERESESLHSTRDQTATALRQSSTGMAQLYQQSAQVEAEAVELAAQKLAEIEALLSETNDKIAGQQLLIARGDVRAPITGTILSRAISGPGAVVRSGETMFELVPATGLVVKAMVKPTDIEHVRMGSSVRLKFSGLNVQKTPTLHGKVTFVAPDVSIDERTKAEYYEVKVEVPVSERAKIRGATLSPGMPVEVMIDSGARSAIAYLLQPIINTYDRSFRE